jgi:predicted AlkP superfamily phosphohydrolase/phosphomutase
MSRFFRFGKDLWTIFGAITFRCSTSSDPRAFGVSIMRNTGLKSGLIALFLILVTLGAFLWPDAPQALGQGGGAASTGGPKAILLGFDGVDYRIAARFIEEGELPNIKKLKEKGSFLPLGTANPAQSPVSWASIVTGTNPGKTNIGGFIKRVIRGNMVMPDLATAETAYQGDDHNLPYSYFSPLSPESKGKWIGILTGAAFLLGLLLFKVLIRLGWGISLLVGVVFAAGGVFFGISFFNELPEQAPFPYNLQQGVPFWDTLSQKNIRTVGLYAPGAYPVVASEDADILGGLGNPDVTGSTGTWYVYSSEAFTFFDIDTNTGGKVIRLNEEGDGSLTGKLFGPTNFFRMDQFKKQIDALKARKDSAKLTVEEKSLAEEELQRTEDEYDNWKADFKKVTLDFKLTPNYQAKSLKVELDGQTQTLVEGRWSDWFKVKFKLSPFLKVPALVRMRLIKCADEEVRFFVPTIDVSPESPPEFIRLSSPAEYTSELTKRAGLYETVGWACITHGLKDEEIPEEVFMEEIEFTMRLRNKLMSDQLSRKDWDVFFEVFYSTDRVQHMMFRLFDDQHPQFNPQLAEKTVSFFHRNIRLKDSILESYREMDRIIGDVMKRIDQGEFGDDVYLMVMSDHGFAPFYHCVGINNLLIQEGFQIIKPDSSGEPQTVKDLMSGSRDPSMLNFVDWSSSKAYSLGLGKVYINLKGREPKGIVEPEDYDAVCDEIVKAFEAFRDPNTGEPVVKKVYKREEIFSGDFWKEGKTDFEFYHPDGERFAENRYTAGFADLYLGFYPKYRVSWGTSLGGLEEEVIVQNEQKWSGDHVSVDPSEVPGVFISNRKMRGKRIPTVVDLVPTLLNLYGMTLPEHLDGEPILLD